MNTYLITFVYGKAVELFQNPTNLSETLINKDLDIFQLKFDIETIDYDCGDGAEVVYRRHYIFFGNHKLGYTSKNGFPDYKFITAYKIFESERNDITLKDLIDIKEDTLDLDEFLKTTNRVNKGEESFEKIYFEEDIGDNLRNTNLTCPKTKTKPKRKNKVKEISLNYECKNIDLCGPINSCEAPSYSYYDNSSCFSTSCGGYILRDCGYVDKIISGCGFGGC